MHMGTSSHQGGRRQRYRYVLPTNKKMAREDSNDQIFRTEPEKYNAITNKIIQCNNKGQPVLVGTTSIEKSEKISENPKIRIEAMTTTEVQTKKRCSEWRLRRKTSI